MSVRAIKIKFVTALLFCLMLINAKNWDLIINTGRRKHFVKVCSIQIYFAQQFYITFSCLLIEAMNCPSGSIFSTCTSACKRTCNNSQNNRKQRNCRKRKCRSGCECPIGQVWHENKCIYKQLCPSHDLQSTQNMTSTINENILKEDLIT